MTFYTGLRTTAARLLGGKGKAMTLRKRTPGTYSPSTGTTEQTSEDHACTGAVLAMPALLIDGTNVQRGDRKVILSADGLEVTPDDGDLLVVGSTVLNIIAAQPVAPDGTVVIYKLQVRR